MTIAASVAGVIGSCVDQADQRDEANAAIWLAFMFGAQPGSGTWGRTNRTSWLVVHAAIVDWRSQNRHDL